MAKGKKGPALFEVIRAAQQKQAEQQRKQELARQQQPGALANAASVLMSPSSWLTGRQTPQQNAPVTPATPVMREVPRQEPVRVETSFPSIVAPKPVETPAAKPPIAQPKPTPVIFEKSEPEARVPEVRSEPRRADVESPAAEAARRVREEIAAASRIKETYDDVSPDAVVNNVHEVFGREPSIDEPRSPRFNFQLPFQLNYRTGLIAGVALLAIAGATIIALRPGGDSQASSQKRHDVLQNVPAEGSQPANEGVASRTPAGPSDTTLGRVNSPAQAVGVENSPKPVALPANGKRVVGVQYVVLMSFPPASAADAKELVNFLADNGVSVTAEQGLPGYSKTWYSVVTTTGFYRTKGNTEYDQYIERVNKLMEKYAKGSRFKSFKPDVYTWRAVR